MAQFRFSRASSAAAMMVLCFINALFSVVVKGQDSEEMLAPSPSMDAGAGFSLPQAGVLVCTSLLLSLVALLWH
ncbi:hypothetical protein ACHQM5_016969 [Ranunculus cassubicifolius]